MAVSKKSLHDALRNSYMEKVSQYLESIGEEVLVVGSNELAIPCVDAEGDDEFIVLTFKVPTGSRDGDAYDGYSMAEDFQMRSAEKKAKAEETARKKAEKIAKDKAMRAAKAEAKAKHLAEKEKGE